jgi:hypothetical protein
MGVDSMAAARDPDLGATAEFMEATRRHLQHAAVVLSRIAQDQTIFSELSQAIHAEDRDRFRLALEHAGLPSPPVEPKCIEIVHWIVTAEKEIQRANRCYWVRTAETGEEIEVPLSEDRISDPLIYTTDEASTEMMMQSLEDLGLIRCRYTLPQLNVKMMARVVRKICQ